MVQCYNCGEWGHKKPDCPQIECHRCHHLGHMARDCQWQDNQRRSRRSRSHIEDSSNERFLSSSNAHKLPSHWRLSEKFPSMTSAVTGMRKRGIKYRIYPASSDEVTEIKRLIRKTWNSDVVGCGADARNLYHTKIKVVNVERVENPELYERYYEKKQKMLRLLRDPDLGDDAFSRVGTLPGSSGPVLTTQNLPLDSGLRRNINAKINEHYLFHGTKDEYVLIIARDGMDNRFGSRSSLLGAGLYTAESCTKADQYTDSKTDRTDEELEMFLVRVLLGEPYVNTEKNPPKFQRPPCRTCQQILCDCPHTVHYDSIMDDAKRRLFREFVVYEQSQCYPEYIITYQRIRKSTADSFENYGSTSSSKNFSSSSKWLPSPASALPYPSARSAISRSSSAKVALESKSLSNKAKLSQVVAVKSLPAPPVLVNIPATIPSSTRDALFQQPTKNSDKRKDITSATLPRSALFAEPDQNSSSSLIKSTFTPDKPGSRGSFATTTNTADEAQSVTDALAFSRMVESQQSSGRNIFIDMKTHSEGGDHLDKSKAKTSSALQPSELGLFSEPVPKSSPISFKSTAIMAKPEANSAITATSPAAAVSQAAATYQNLPLRKSTKTLAQRKTAEAIAATFLRNVQAVSGERAKSQMVALQEPHKTKLPDSTPSYHLQEVKLGTESTKIALRRSSLFTEPDQKAPSAISKTSVKPAKREAEGASTSFIATAANDIPSIEHAAATESPLSQQSFNSPTSAKTTNTIPSEEEYSCHII